MLQDIERLQLAALLHDIGKFRQRTIATPPFRPHERHGWEFVTLEGSFIRAAMIWAMRF